MKLIHPADLLVSSGPSVIVQPRQRPQQGLKQQTMHREKELWVVSQGQVKAVSMR